jgi:hypothetical protein
LTRAWSLDVNKPLADPAAPAVRKRRRWLSILAIVVVPALVWGGVRVYQNIAADRELQEAIDETDRLDPRWRLADLEADRAQVPEERNAAGPAAAVKGLLPKGWPAWEVPVQEGPPEDEERRQALADGFANLEPQRRLNDEQTIALRREMKRAEKAVGEARKLTERSEGRHPIRYADDWVSTDRTPMQDVRRVATLLGFDAMLRAEEGDADGALASCRAVLNAGRSIGDEPFMISQLVRIACMLLALDRAERVLAQGQPSEEALRRWQELLEKEVTVPRLLIAIRGERAGSDRLMEGLQTGKVKHNAVEQRGREERPLPTSTRGFKEQRAALLRYLNRAVEIARLPPDQQIAEYQELERTVKQQPAIVQLLAPAMEKFARACHRIDASLQCAIVAAAAERYRRAKGQWPAALEALKEAGYLKAVPSDPFDGKPLRWRRLNDGLVFYSVGPDGKDHGGTLDRRNRLEKGTNFGSQLWIPAKRRQAAVPLPKRGPRDGGEVPPPDRR